MKIADEELAAARASTLPPAAPLARRAGRQVHDRAPRPPAVDVDYASEYRYRNPIPDRNALGLLITQSGETADTLAAQREMIALDRRPWPSATCDAMVAREAHGAIYTHAGPEIGVASPRHSPRSSPRFFWLAMKLGQLRGRLDPERSVALIEELSRIPAKIEKCCALARRNAKNWPRTSRTHATFSTGSRHSLSHCA